MHTGWQEAADHLTLCLLALGEVLKKGAGLGVWAGSMEASFSHAAEACHTNGAGLGVWVGSTKVYLDEDFLEKELLLELSIFINKLDSLATTRATKKLLVWLACHELCVGSISCKW